MKTWQVFVLCVVTVLLAAAVVIAQVAFRLDRTVLSYGFLNRTTQAWLDPLDDASVHARTVEGAYRAARRAAGVAIPRELDPHVVRAATEAFSTGMIRHTVANWVIEIHRVIRGDRTQIVLPVALSPFKNAMLSEIRSGFSPDEVRAFAAAVETIPASLDLVETMPDAVQRRIVNALRRSTFLSVLLQYVFPGILIAACFFHRRIGLGVFATGIAFAAAGIPTLIAAYLHAETAARLVDAGLAGLLPEYVSWLRTGMGSTVQTIIESGRVASLIVTGYGVAAILVGGFVIATGRDVTVGE
ncbi:MAG: hypothetical protein EA426_13385 [Spirochaetaceae bacterium]|nr:MAG: hypothetical protein EA426_13385 [Spirochaetaceae bacterium]